jgi:hypothetical protein
VGVLRLKPPFYWGGNGYFSPQNLSVKPSEVGF